MKKIIILIFLTVAVSPLYAQISSESQAKAMLKGKDITEDELTAKLNEKGVDLDNIAPADLPSIQGKVEAAIKEIEASKSGKSSSESGSSVGLGPMKEVKINPEDSKLIIDENASVKEQSTRVKEALKTSQSNVSLIYGHSVFTDKTLSFYSTSEVATPPNYYVLDVGDRISINIFGRSQADLIYEIEDDGFIRPTGMYKVYLKGLSYGDAKDLLYKRFQMAYTYGKGQFNVGLTSARTISVNIYGEVNNPGRYTLSALNNALSALIAAGGPTEKGSVRSIQIINGEKKTEVDLYDFLTNPKSAEGYGLRNNSVIFIPPILNKVELNGPFTRTGFFELKPTENVNDLVKIAGGVNKSVSLDNYNIVRINSQKKELTTYNYESRSTPVLEDLDVISFKSVSSQYSNFVAVEGAVKFAGEYQYSSTIKIADLLALAGLQDYTRRDIAYLSRINQSGEYSIVPINLKMILEDPKSNSNIILNPRDKLILLDSRSFTSSFYYSISGQVRKENPKVQLSEKSQLRLSDAILLAEGLKENATEFGYIVRTSQKNSNDKEFILVNITKALSGEIEFNPFIARGDSILIPSNENFSDKYFVNVGGAVRKAGQFHFAEGMTLNDALLLSGGLKPEAEPAKIDIFRIGKNEKGVIVNQNFTVSVDLLNSDFNNKFGFVLQANDVIEVRSTPNYGKVRVIEIKGEVLYPGTYAISSTNERISDIIQKAGGLTAEADIRGGNLVRIESNIGPVITNFSKIGRGRNKNDLIVKDKDVVIIPKLQDVVQIAVVGTNAGDSYDKTLINNGKITVPYSGNRRAKWYIINYAGGFDKNAKRSKTTVQYSGGRMVKTKNFGLFRIYPKVNADSKIITSEKEKKEKKEPNDKKDRDVFSDVKDVLALTISAITVIVLSQNLK